MIKHFSNSNTTANKNIIYTEVINFINNEENTKIRPFSKLGFLSFSKRKFLDDRHLKIFSEEYFINKTGRSINGKKFLLAYDIETKQRIILYNTSYELKFLNVKTNNIHVFLQIYEIFVKHAVKPSAIIRAKKENETELFTKYFLNKYCIEENSENIWFDSIKNICFSCDKTKAYVCSNRCTIYKPTNSLVSCRDRILTIDLININNKVDDVKRLYASNDKNEFKEKFIEYYSANMARQIEKFDFNIY